MLDELSPVNRPVTLFELAVAFDLSKARMRRFLDRHSILPACRIGNTPVYGPVQIRRAFAALEAAQP
jgi:hypothetical protein